MLAALNARFRRNVSAFFTRPVDALAHERLRLRLLFSVAVIKLFNFIGGAWDIQWHIEIGRDSLFIPPHLLVMVAFFSGVGMVLVMIAYESGLARGGHEQPHTLRLGPFRGDWPFFSIFFGYSFALLSGLVDELWHEVFGIDATLWSPPHLMIMAATVVVDFSLLLGITASARRLGYSFSWKSPLTWGILLVGAYTFESVNFQMGEAFIVGYRNGGAGLYGLLFPILFGVMLPLSLVTVLRLSGRFWTGLAVLGVTLTLQYLATGIAAAGFAILKPVSVIEEYVRLNPDSTAAVSREFARLLGFNGLIGFHQAWTMMLAAPALALVALLGFIPWARHRPMIAAPVFSAGMVILSYGWFQFVPLLHKFPIRLPDVLLGALISVTGGMVMGWIGYQLAGRFTAPDLTRPSPPPPPR
jgi:hypothetical protein